MTSSRKHRSGAAELAHRMRIPCVEPAGMFCPLGYAQYGSTAYDSTAYDCRTVRQYGIRLPRRTTVRRTATLLRISLYVTLEK
eukprot:gene9468-biopygen6744